ncbi:MAG: hypothetical protein HGA67_03345 [Candidatus Yonathbacteria bacterium]|nr:hypothetical protein [Candidatus Yonathbacteria bacterium]
MTYVETLKETLSRDLIIALREKDVPAVTAIKSLMARIDNAGAVDVQAPLAMPMAGGVAGASGDRRLTEVSRKEVSEDDVARIIREEIDEIVGTLDILARHGRPDEEHLAEQADVLRRYA